MRTITKTFEVYKFDELTADAKDKALENHNRYNDMSFLSDDLSYKLSELLKSNKIDYNELPELQYSLSYSQGDGVMFEGIVYWKSYKVDITHSGHYYHYNSKSFDITNVKTDKDAKKEVYEQFNEVYVDICQELEKYGYDLIEYEQSAENFREMCEANDWEFYANGSMV